MKMTMLKTLEGTANAMGSATKEYVEGETYDMVDGWAIALANTWIEQGVAQEVKAIKKETKIVAPKETQAEDAPKKKSK